ncbi:MAG: hypothetical protein BKP49_01165 [Treponema sp. CETP13]|nr:MAG: hypothetical protein BKP49_01165 [Treponema sp. CETP13]
MKVHNILEEVVNEKVNDMYEKVKSMPTAWLTCDCNQCREDTISYVLNRLPPRYIVSGRGITHQAVLEDRQTLADIDALTIEGMKKVALSKRSYHGLTTNIAVKAPTGPAFNFPAFLGSVSDGDSFDTIEGAKISLSLESTLADMIDHTWLNPIITSKISKGRYSFWVKPISTSKVGEQKNFNFTIEISAPKYESVQYTFSVPVVSTKSAELVYNATYSLQLPTLCLFPTEK